MELYNNCVYTCTSYMYIDAHLSLKHVQMYLVLVFGVIGGFITGGK